MKIDVEERKPTQSVEFYAGICLHDLLKNQNWSKKVFQKNYFVLIEISKSIISLEFSDYRIRNLQAKIVSQLLTLIYAHQRQHMFVLIEFLAEQISDGEYNSIDASLRTLIYLIENIEDEDLGKEFHDFIAPILSAILSAFTNENIGEHGREQIFHILYQCLRCISWADGIDNELVDECLNETFNQWMVLFIQVIQSKAKKFFDIKRNALKCLTVIFRDFINYSRECINMILRPAWKLLNMHLPIFTEVCGYNQNINDLKTLMKQNGETSDQDGAQGDSDSQDDEEIQKDNERRGFESEEENEIDEPHGIRGMTLQLIELLTTLVQRPNVQEVVRQGINPLLITVSSYMILEKKDHRIHYADENFFLHDKTQSIYKIRNIKNQCVDLFSSLIDIFGDQAVKSTLLVITNLLDVQNLFETQLEESKQQETNEELIPVDKQNLKVYTYISSNSLHIWKRKDVAMVLLGIFIEDVMMFLTRNPQLNLTSLIEEIINIKFDEGGCMSPYLKGRALWCATNYSEGFIAPSDQTLKLKNQILDLAIATIKQYKLKSIKLISTRAINKYARKMKKDNLIENAPKFETVLDDLLELLDYTSMECMYLPIEAFQTFSRVNSETVSQMAPKVTPKLLTIFKTEHSEGNLGQELINLFKLWCQYDDCRDIFINTFIPFIIEIVESYYNSTPNEENKDSQLKLSNISDSLSSIDSSNEKNKFNQETNIISVVDSTILSHVLDLLCTLLKKTDKEKYPQEFEKIIAVFPQILNFVKKSEDMFLLLHGTSAIKNFIFEGHKEILKIVKVEQIVEVAIKLLSPTANEQAAICLGNLIIQIFHKIQPEIDTNVLFCVVQKIYKTRMPSTLQSLVLIFARLIMTNPKEIVQLLSETSVDNRISLKVVLDKWLLQQPLFRGPYTSIVTISALQKLYMMLDQRIELLMVIGYNPSHANINSEVNAPFKILSSLLRFIENEEKLQNSGKLRPVIRPPDPYGFEEENAQPQPSGLGTFGGYTMARAQNLPVGAEMSRERLDTDTMDGFNDYDSDEDENNNMDRMKDSDDDNNSDDSDVDSMGRKKKRLNGSQEKIEVTLDDVNDDSDQECLLDYKQNEANKRGSADGMLNSSKESKKDEDNETTGSATFDNLITIKESNDRGLADMETGSEVYMSELLAGFDMEDFDDADQQNEEDLMLLGDHFAQVQDLKAHLIEQFRIFVQDKGKYPMGKDYVKYCIKQLHDDDQELAKKYIEPLYEAKNQIEEAKQ